ncbi:MAG: peptide deformylase [Sediminibacterium sp.]|nr:peptide deformylase [Sediminibacterium sp.]
MKLPIVAYGSSLLRTQSKLVSPDYPNLKELISDMFETMYAASGCGLAGCQIGKPIQLIVFDTLQLEERRKQHNAHKADLDKSEQGMKLAIINPVIKKIYPEKVEIEEGCLSIPFIHIKVSRVKELVLSYQDANFEFHQVKFGGFNARVFLHEYDHLQGKLITDYLSIMKRKLISRKLKDISNLNVNTDYEMYLPDEPKI